MIWLNKPDDGWRKWFALLPVAVGGETVWLQWYWRRFWGDHYQVAFADPRQPTVSESSGASQAPGPTT